MTRKRPRSGKEANGFEPLTQAQHAVIARAAPASRGKTVSSIHDPKHPGKTQKQLDAWPESAAETLELVKRFAHLHKKFGGEYDLSLSLFYPSSSGIRAQAIAEAIKDDN